MIASNIRSETLTSAASAIGVRAETHTLSESGLRHRVKLYPVTPDSAWQVDERRLRLCPVCGERVRIKGHTPNRGPVGSCGDSAPASRWASGRRWSGERGDAPYQRLSASGFRAGRVHAVCWHGFRDYFRQCFLYAPDARFYTAIDKWLGSEDFEARYRASAHRNIGSQAYPMRACDACRCKERGHAQ